ncbi:indigoidine synthase A-like protein [Fistulina hepatica ATCC 64428]|uniref:Indigoidine synthase A-like protein n=1 Tax=Fistulina hepatica ATCC 64428 TaxID=1128425 RepID=A0A0D7AME5_9AGAR|nr:indigoidine synthase A-like protein [Fistulina hepatica ATCC 64428]
MSTQSKISLALARKAPIDIHPEIEHALETSQPLVALESTLITHGFQTPENYNLALSLERNVRDNGATPATIGFIGGRIKIGLTPAEIERLASNQYKPVKVSRRDIAPAIANKADGGTTCAATSMLAEMVGIKVFATGGLGGVHRGGENTMDISADLQELSRTPVGLVSAGVKSILDIGRTLEYLETLGVPVISYSKTRDFPAFFSKFSGFQVPYNTDDPRTAAEILFTQWQLSMTNGVLIAVPIPDEYQAAGDEIQKAVDIAVAESETNGMSKSGRDATPWLLKRVNELTQGSSEQSNIGLLQNTARVGGQIAVEYQKLVNASKYEKNDVATFVTPPPTLTAPTSFVEASPSPAAQITPPSLVVIGSAAVDISARADTSLDAALTVHSTVPGEVTSSLGGVARNIAEASHRICASPTSTLLLAPVGDDMFGSIVIDGTARLGMRTDGLLRSSTDRTAVCNMIFDAAGNLLSGVADMNITRSFSAIDICKQLGIHEPAMVVLDGNLAPETISVVVQHCNKRDIPVFFEPTSVVKSTSILPAVQHSLSVVGPQSAPIAFMSPNLLELEHVYRTAMTEPFDLMSSAEWWTALDALRLGDAFRLDVERLARTSAGGLAFLKDKGIVHMAVNLLPFFQHLIIKCGAAGVLVVMRVPGWTGVPSDPGRALVVASSEAGTVVVRHFPAHHIPPDSIVNVTGAGDSFVGALLAVLQREPTAMQHPHSLEQAIDVAQRAAVMTLQSTLAVSPLLSELAKK